MSWPALHPDISVMETVELDAGWEFFEFYEAGHRNMDIMNPLSSDGLDQVVAAIEIRDGQRVLDIGSGHGELLLRLAAKAPIHAQAVDLSPWQLNRSARRVAEVGLKDRIHHLLGDGADTPAAPDWDVVCGLGISWVWTDFAGTVRALAGRTRPGGRVVIGDVYHRSGSQSAEEVAELGQWPTVAEQRATLTAAGIGDLVEIRPGREDWEAYNASVIEGLDSWVAEHPEDAEFLDRGAEWRDPAGLLDKLGWNVWIGTKS